MSRCKHEEITIREVVIADKISTKSNGYWDSEISVKGHGGRLRVVCGMCGMDRIFYRNPKSLPKWLQQYLKELELPF
jgi:hypothetical protein